VRRVPAVDRRIGDPLHDERKDSCLSPPPTRALPPFFVDEDTHPFRKRPEPDCCDAIKEVIGAVDSVTKSMEDVRRNARVMLVACSVSLKQRSGTVPPKRS
jgi:hypothetical protein